MLLLSLFNWFPIGNYFFGLYNQMGQGVNIIQIVGGFKRMGHAFLQMFMIPVLTSSLNYSNTNSASILLDLTYR